VRLTLADSVVNLLEEHVDIALRIGELPDSSLVAKRIGTIRRVVCASRGYLKTRGVPMKPDDLATHDCITFAGSMSSKSWSFASKAGQRAVTIHSRLIVNTAEAALDMAIAGLGVTRVLSYQAAQAVANDKLSIVLQPFEPEPVPVSLVQRSQGLLPLKLRAFLDFAAPRLRTALAESNDLVAR
jgi:DNA-binding transcriptional LysR family regulator